MGCVYLGGRVNLTFVLILPIFPTVVFFKLCFLDFLHLCIFCIFVLLYFLYFLYFCTLSTCTSTYLLFLILTVCGGGLTSLILWWRATLFHFVWMDIVTSIKSQKLVPETCAKVLIWLLICKYLLATISARGREQG